MTIARVHRAVLLCAALLLPAAALHAEVIDGVLVTVNGRLILRSDVAASLAFGTVTPTADGDVTEAVLAALIRRSLELDEVERYAQPDPPTEAVEREMAALGARFPSRAAFNRALALTGKDLSSLREVVRDDLRIQAYLNQRFVADGDRRAQLMDEWLAGLRRRAEIFRPGVQP